MFVRWTIDVVGVVALAALTVTAEMPWLTKAHPEMELTAGGSETLSGSAPEASQLSCPADAKPANLNFTLKDANDRDVSLSKYKGKVLVIDFWATWCGPCKVEIPHFIEFQEKYGKAGLQIVGISVDDTADKLAPYIRDMKMNYPVLQGLNHDEVQDAYGPIVGIPVSVMISRDGKVCATHTGLTSKDVFEREIKSLL
jgi:cytochrome c biogenesis protein CcmG, thiol:disulfide interchange protein DsbE